MKQEKARPEFQIRSFVADYRDSDNNYYHSVHQVVCFGEHTQEQVVIALKEKLEHKGYIVVYIIEAFGDHTIDGLQRIVASPTDAVALKMKPVYADLAELRKAAV